MHIEVEGSGPPLVLIHGWAMHGGIFAPLSRRLAEHFTLHLVDLPGHGHSAGSGERLRLDACVNTLFDRLPAAPWLGWSLGGLIALRAALRDPARVPQLLMLCATPCFVRSADWPDAVEAEVFASFAADLGRDYRATIDRFLALEAHGSDHLRHDLRELRAHVFERGEPHADVLVDGLELLQGVDLHAALPVLEQPSLWLSGRRDRLVPWTGMQRAATRAGGEFIRFEQAGHAPFLSHADEVAAAILDFLRRTAR